MQYRTTEIIHKIQFTQIKVTAHTPTPKFNFELSKAVYFLCKSNYENHLKHEIRNDLRSFPALNLFSIAY